MVQCGTQAGTTDSETFEQWFFISNSRYKATEKNSNFLLHPDWKFKLTWFFTVLEEMGEERSESYRGEGHDVEGLPYTGFECEAILSRVSSVKTGWCVNRIELWGGQRVAESWKE